MTATERSVAIMKKMKMEMEIATLPPFLSITCSSDHFLINILFITIIKEQQHALS